MPRKNHARFIPSRKCSPTYGLIELLKPIKAVAAITEHLAMACRRCRGEVLDVLVKTRTNKRAALKLMRKLQKKYGLVPEKLITDDLRSYSSAASELGIVKRHERGRWRNNRAENSHQI
jgi:transposase-like protein